MATCGQFNQCCNPLKLDKHRPKKGLRRASEALQALWNLNRYDYLCTQCRVKLQSTQRAIDDNSNSDDTENADNQVHEIPDTPQGSFNLSIKIH